jgi:hypothetical protein
MFLDQGDISRRGIVLLLLVLSLLPFGSIWFQENTVISIAESEFAVKYWGYIQFWDVDRFFGGQITEVGFPTSRMLNNPDIVATFVVGTLAPLIGGSTAFNLLLWLVMFSNLASLYWLGRQLGISRVACLSGTVVFGWNSLLLSYGFASNISDLIHLWPYALSLGFLITGLKESQWIYGVYAGLCIGLGFLSCPYNFVLFIPALVLLLPWVFWQYGKESWRILLASACMGGVICAIYAWHLYAIMNAETSLVHTEDVQDVRHSYPFVELLPQNTSRFTLYLSELFTFGSDGLVMVEQVARFARSFYLGWVAMVVAFWGMYKSPDRTKWLWGGILILFVLIASGPYLNWSYDVHLKNPWNPLYLFTYYGFNGRMILEPFRYYLVAVLGLSMLVTIAVQCIQGLKTRLLVVLLIGVDLSFGSAVKFPLPTKSFEPSDEMQAIRELPKGGVIHLPFFVQGRNLFDRSHFAYQLEHEHPIGDPIMGFPPQAYLDNPLMCRILNSEHSFFPMHRFPCETETISTGIEDLQQKGFVAIVIETEKYDAKLLQQITGWLEKDLSLLSSSGSVLIYPIPLMKTIE